MGKSFQAKLPDEMKAKIDAEEAEKPATASSSSPSSSPSPDHYFSSSGNRTSTVTRSKLQKQKDSDNPFASLEEGDYVRVFENDMKNETGTRWINEISWTGYVTGSVCGGKDIYVKPEQPFDKINWLITPTQDFFEQMGLYINNLFDRVLLIETAREKELRSMSFGSGI